MAHNKYTNIFSQMNAFEVHIGQLEQKILELENHIESLIQIERNHLVRIKNNEELSDEFIIKGRKYQDLTPDKAWKQYCNKNFDFIMIDVSDKNFSPERKIPEANHIPWEDFQERFFEIQSKTIPLLIICEDGTKSVLACEFLSRLGYYNCNNVSGGYKHWRGFQYQGLTGISA